MTVFERRPNGHVFLEISSALLGVWFNFQDQTDFLQLGYVPSLLMLPNKSENWLINLQLDTNSQYSIH